MTPRTSFSSREAVLLAHPLVSRVADGIGARVVFIKGPVSEAFRLRPPRDSSDVDVWVDPRRAGDLIRALGLLGWRPRQTVESPRVLQLHSETLIHSDWPCDIDVHHMYPGFFESPEHVFEQVWERRTCIDVAGVDVPCGDLIVSSAVLALHALRDADDARNRAEADYLVTALGARLDEGGRASLVAFATDTGAVESLRPVLARVAPRELATVVPDDRFDEQLSDWLVRTRGGTSLTTAVLLTIVKSPPLRRPRLVVQALLPSDRRMLDAHPELMHRGRAALIAARISRLGRGIRALPRAVAALRARRATRP